MFDQKLIAKKRHELFLRKMGYKKPKKRLQIESYWKDSYLSIDLNNRNPAPLSNNIHVSGGYRKDIDDYKWKRSNETPETIKEIERKKTRIAPAYNKGANQYITDGDDIKTLGKKI